MMEVAANDVHMYVRQYIRSNHTNALIDMWLRASMAQKSKRMLSQRTPSQIVPHVVRRHKVRVNVVVHTGTGTAVLLCPPVVAVDAEDVAGFVV